jgi:hypothetical protein
MNLVKGEFAKRVVLHLDIKATEVFPVFVTNMCSDNYIVFNRRLDSLSHCRWSASMPATANIGTGEKWIQRLVIPSFFS